MNAPSAKIAACALTLALLAPSPARAEDAFDYFREEAQAAVASKKTESVAGSPGVISVITSRDLENAGYSTLGDLLQSLPGVTGTESFFGYSSLSFRGIKETHYNNRSLLLLNGVPIRGVVVGTYWLESIPAGAIERVEVIRGPGSVVHGNGAFSGVISVITKSGVDATELTAAAGNRGAVSNSVLHGRSKGSFGYLIVGSKHDSRGYRVAVRDEAGTIATLGEYPDSRNGFQNNHHNLFGGLTLGRVKLEAFHFESLKDKFGIIPNHLTTGETQTEQSGIALRHAREIAGTDVKSMLYYGRDYHLSRLDHFPATTASPALDISYRGDKLGGAVDGQRALNDRSSALVGAAFEWQGAAPYLFRNHATGQTSDFTAFTRGYTTYDASLYGQLEATPADPLTVVAGARLNNNRTYGGTVVPRIGLVIQARDDLFFKALYSAAYRNPTFFEKHVNTKNVLYGDPNLKPEKIDSFEVSSDFRTKHNIFTITAFLIKTSGMINREAMPAGVTPPSQLEEMRSPDTTPTVATPWYKNTSGQQIEGVEIDVKGTVAWNAVAYALNYSYKDGRERTPYTVAGTQTAKKIQYLDQHAGNASLAFTRNKFVNTLSLRYVGPREGNISAASTAPGFTPGQAVTIPAYAVVNLKIRYRATSHVEVAVTALNLFAQRYSHPEYVRRNIDAVPGDSDRSLTGQLTLKF